MRRPTQKQARNVHAISAQRAFHHWTLGFRRWDSLHIAKRNRAWRIDHKYLANDFPNHHRIGGHFDFQASR